MDYSVYIHIPFCVKKCAYCDFNSFSCDNPVKEEYIKALLKEIENDTVISDNDRIDTVFIGGGTPSLLSPEQIKSILSHFGLDENAEVTMEANPKTVTAESLRGYLEAGVNRISIGVQSFEDSELAVLGRIHTAEDAEQAVKLAKQVGFSNINIDIMKDIPKQSAESLKRSLLKAVELGVTHISVYSLIVEEDTPIYDAFEQGLYTYPDEEESVYTDELIHDFLKEKGYAQYEISNYSRKDYRCRHNEGYWQRKPYRGYGLSAASLIVDKAGNNYRFTAERGLEDYIEMSQRPLIERVRAEEEYRKLSVSEQMEEFVFLGLRQNTGISEKVFYDYFKVSLSEIYGNIIEKYIAEKLMLRDIRDGDIRYRLSDKGLMVSNVVLADFLMEEE